MPSTPKEEASKQQDDDDVIPYRTNYTPKSRVDRYSGKSNQSHPDDIVPLSSSRIDEERVVSLHLSDDNANMLFRYRADSLRSTQQSETDQDAESRLWHICERVFCFLKGMPVYHVRRKLMFTIIVQSVISTFRILPIILGLNYQSVVPVFILYFTLILGWHGVKFLIPKFLLFYKIGMQLSLFVDILWYILRWNGNTNTVSEGTALTLQIFASVVLLIANVVGLLLGWKLRRIVKSMRHQRECDRATFAEVGSNIPSRQDSVSSGITRLSMRMPSAVASDGNQPPSNRRVQIGKVEKEQVQYCPNEIRTSKYTYYNFIYVFLMIQFSRLANVYTTVIVFLCFFDFSPVSPVASLTPLLIVFASSAFKDVTEDSKRRKADAKVNNKPVELYRKMEEDGSIQELSVQWKDVKVGDIVCLTKDDEAPSDLLILSTSNEDNRCYVATANLDGETNMKIRSVPLLTRDITNAHDLLQNHALKVECDAPNRSLFDFNGSMVLDDKVCSLSMDNMILRGSDLKSSEWTLGLVIYTGPDTRIALNGSEIQLKRSRVEKTLNSMLVLILVIVFSIAVACSLGNNSWSFVLDRTLPWYLLDSDPDQDEPENNFIFLSYVILFNNMIPLSMYVTMEAVRFIYARYVDNDLEMYDEATDTPAQARNSNIIEDLGQIQYIFSDKTGTLTQNEMIFAKCSVSGLKYGDAENTPDDQPLITPGTRFRDPRLISRLQAQHHTAKEIHEFLMLLTICNTVIPAHDETTGQMRYQASSPDEESLVFAAYALGYKLERRDGKICHVNILGRDEEWEILAVLEFNSDRKRMSVVCRGPDQKIRLYCKGADSIILKRLAPDRAQQGVVHVTVGHLQEYAADGLRTLTTAMKIIDPNVYEKWAKNYMDASLCVQGRAEQLARVAECIEIDLALIGATAIEDRLQDGVAECISSLRTAGINFWVLTGDKKETAISVGMSSQVIDDTMDVIFLGDSDKASLIGKLEELYVDLVEDKWVNEQDSAGRVLWETTKRLTWSMYENIMAALSGRGQDKIKRRRRRNRDVDADGESNLNEFSLERQASNPEIVVDLPVDKETDATKGEEEVVVEEEIIEYAMVIDGQTLTMLLQDDIKYLFLAVARQCKSVICCRCSPAQKAAVVTLVTQPRLMWGPGFLSLAIGDGANDVPMIQSASVGVGISGKEGRQAVLSSDFSIAQFKFLKRLLLVHGNYSYKRISKLILFSFMKNVALALSNFWFAVQTLYSGLLMYFGILFTLYNALFTTIPIVFVAIYNQDVPTNVLMRHSTLYHNGLHNRSFNWGSFFGWCALGIWHAYVIFLIPFTSDGYYRDYTKSSENPDGYLYSDTTYGLWADGIAAYTYLVVASTAQVSLLTSNWTKYNAAAVLGTLSFYFLFIWFLSSLFGWSGVDMYESFRATGVLIVLFQEPWFWLGMLLAATSATLPNYILKAGRVLFYPEPSHLIREWNTGKQPSTTSATFGDIPLRPRLVRKNTGFAFSKHSEAPELF